MTPAVAGQRVWFDVAAGQNEGDTGFVETDALGQATLSYLGDGGVDTVDTDAIVVWVDLNPNGVIDGDEPTQIATKTWTTTTAAVVVSLEPQTDTNPVGTSHQLTATVSPAQDDVWVRFEVLSGPNAGVKLVAVTNSSGVATASYVGAGGADVDVIVAWADNDRDELQDGDEPALAALKTWTDSSDSGLALSPTADTNPIGTSHTLTATLTPAQNNVRIRFEVLIGDPNGGDTRSDRTNSSGVAQVSYVGDGGTGTDTIIAWADFDNDSRRDGDEPSAIATKTWTSSGGTVTSLVLAPVTDTNPVGTSHTLTATVSPAQSGVTVRFEVVTGPNGGTTRSDGTNSSGVATTSYVGNGGAGVDTVIAWADLDRDARRDSDEPSAVATKTWTGTGAVTTIALAPAADSNPIGTSHTLTATVTPRQSGVSVRFGVVSGPNVGTTRSGSSNSSGVVTSSYVGGSAAGIDTVIAWADLDRDGRRDGNEPSAVATKSWTAQVLGTFISGSVPRFGFGLIVWGGGSSDLLASASGCGTLTSQVRFWATEVVRHQGEFVVFVPSSRVQLVNARWFALFPGGFAPANTVLLATCGG